MALSGQDLTVTVNCATGSVRRTVTFPSGRQYASGMVSTVTIDMSSATPVSVSESNAAFLNNTVPGFYPASGTFVSYEAGVNQLCREYVDGKVAFSIVAPATSEMIAMSGIPAAAAMGDSFAISYTSISELGIASKSFNVTVVKEDGALLWLLGSEGDRFIVKK